MIKRGSFTQSTAASVWEVSNLPEGAKKARPLAVYDENGNSHEIDSWEFQGGVLRVSFGIDPVIGELEYEYQIEGEDPTTVEGSGGVINVHQYNYPKQ
ncbi:hypothetical protein vBVpP1_40 [Vibrio phage vB_VpP_1]|nr:hypothetical protein vBVpP1_40 [Vibrio phage vB_VpP_1]